MDQSKKTTVTSKKLRIRRRREARMDEFADKVVELAAERAGVAGNKMAMDTMGYVLVAKEGNLVRIDRDGTNTIIRPLVWKQKKVV